MIKVLVIEDKEDHLKIIEEILDASKYVFHYSHGKGDGIEIAFRYTPDVILFHINNPADHLLLRQLVVNDATCILPIFVISQNPSFEEQRMVMEYGIDDYLPQNLLGDSLAASIANRAERIERRKKAILESYNSFEAPQKESKRADHLLVKLGTKLKLVRFDDIVCITALKEYSTIKTSENLEILVRKSMRTWEQMLPAKNFLRIHRATIINLDYIDKIVQTSARTYTVSLKGIKETFMFSYRYANVMRRTFPS